MTDTRKALIMRVGSGNTAEFRKVDNFVIKRK